MTRHVPILEFIHELRTAGIRLQYDDLVRNPQEYWTRLPEGRRALLMARLRLEPPGDGAVEVRVVRRRARSASPENVFLAIEAQNDPRPFFLKLARESLLYGEFRAPEVSEESSSEDLLVAEAFTRPIDDARKNVVQMLDGAWGEEPYDLAAEGSFVHFDPPDDSTELARYPVEPGFAEVAVLREGNENIYQIIEPQLTELELALVATLNERLRDALVLDEIEDEDEETPQERLCRLYFELLRAYRLRVERRTAYKLGYYFIRNYLGMGRLDPMLRDPHIEDISCNGPGLPLYVVHSRYQNLASNLIFDEMELNAFTIKLAQKGGKLLSVAQPLVDATLPDGSRIQASLGREVTSRGSAFTIRKFREDPLTAVDLIRGGTHSVDTMAFLWLMVELKRSLVVMGATASGKTTTLNCLSQFVPPTLKVVTIEDTREITLQHENWLAAVTRESFTGSESEKITMYDLLRAALRQRPEYIIVGEIRGVEGLTLFQAMSTGHTCFSTMHAGSVENAVYRLENPPIGVPRVMLTSLDLMLLQGQVDVDGEPRRRMIALTEINGMDPASRNLRTNDIFKWDAETDTLASANPSYVLDQARAKRGWSRAELEADLQARRDVLQGLVDRNERNFREVAKAVAKFYSDRALGEAPESGRGVDVA